LLDLPGIRGRDGLIVKEPGAVLLPEARVFIRPSGTLRFDDPLAGWHVVESPFSRLLGPEPFGRGNVLLLEGIVYDAAIGSAITLPPLGNGIPSERGYIHFTERERQLMRESHSLLGTARSISLRVLEGPGAALFEFAFLSFIIGVVNLFPIYPLDGGQIVTTMAEGLVPKQVLLFVRIASLAFFLGFLLTAEVKGYLLDAGAMIQGFVAQVRTRFMPTQSKHVTIDDCAISSTP
jgi:hypothetical protein